ncbi:MAG: hypothetical protein AUH08_08460 [Verrucomicrobia bacterium 13_2_20CM_54_12]|nr:MAG: hypothetical protein AUH08_08460 [Verrucomicrobia bacterium 13_2_20CM_54_12]
MIGITDLGYNTLAIWRWWQRLFYACRRRRCLSVPIEFRRRLRAVKIAPVGNRSAGAFQSEQDTESQPVHVLDGTKCS